MIPHNTGCGLSECSIRMQECRQDLVGVGGLEFFVFRFGNFHVSMRFARGGGGIWRHVSR